jgi:hypothetical protein
MSCGSVYSSGACAKKWRRTCLGLQAHGGSIGAGAGAGARGTAADPVLYQLLRHVRSGGGWNAAAALDWGAGGGCAWAAAARARSGSAAAQRRERWSACRAAPPAVRLPGP